MSARNLSVVSNDFIIEKGIPKPPHYRNGPGRPRTSKWWLLKPGDSVFLAGVYPSDIGGSLGAPKKAGRKFTTCVVDGGTRVWRTS